MQIMFGKFVFGELIVLRHLSMDYITFLNVMLKDLRKLSLSFKIKT